MADGGDAGPVRPLSDVLQLRQQGQQAHTLQSTTVLQQMVMQNDGSGVADGMDWSHNTGGPYTRTPDLLTTLYSAYDTRQRLETPSTEQSALPRTDLVTQPSLQTYSTVEYATQPSGCRRT